MRILIANTHVPFARGGAEMHAEGLVEALTRNGHHVDMLRLPFKWYPPQRILESILSARLLDVAESCGVPVDLVIGLRFPAYFVPHARKVLWILHQYRAAYDLWGHQFGDLHRFPDGVQVRECIQQADRQMIPEAKQVFTNSRNVSARLRRFCDIGSTPLYHPPPLADSIHCEAAHDYLFFPSRINPLKRQGLVIEALARTRNKVLVKFSGIPDDPGQLRELNGLAARLGVRKRIEWLGHVGDRQLVDLYARCLGVLYPVVDEDYGYVTLESMLASKPIISCRDSGGPLEFLMDGVNSVISEPECSALATAMDTLWDNRAASCRMGIAGHEYYRTLNISWDAAVSKLTACA